MKILGIIGSLVLQVAWGIAKTIERLRPKRKMANAKNDAENVRSSDV